MPLFPVVENGETRDYLSGAACGDLRITQDIDTGEFREPRLDWTQQPDRFRGATAGGCGTIVSWSVNHAKDGMRHLFGIVELDEGPWLWSEIVGNEPLTDLSGRRVCAAFVASGPAPEHAVVPIFELIPEPPR